MCVYVAGVLVLQVNVRLINCFDVGIVGNQSVIVFDMKDSFI